jgi:hypothetical protein
MTNSTTEDLSKTGAEDQDWAAAPNQAFDRFLDIATTSARSGGESKTASSSSEPKDGVGSKPGTGEPKDTTSPNGQEKVEGSEGRNTDPLASMTLDTLLKHPTLGPQLNSWMDKGVNSRMPHIKEQLKRELAPEILAETQYNDDKQYLESLSDEERGQVLAQDPELASTWARIQATRQQPGNVNPETIAVAAQTYALGMQIKAYDTMVNESDLPADQKQALLDIEPYKGQGIEGFNSWSQNVLQKLIEHKIEQGIQAQLETRWTSYREDQSAQNPSRPGLQPPGRRQSPRPDFREGSTHEFMDAFQ